MKKIKTKRELNIPGWGRIPAGTTFKVTKYNKRFVYVSIPEHEHVELRLARKANCEVIY